MHSMACCSYLNDHIWRTCVPQNVKHGIVSKNKTILIL